MSWTKLQNSIALTMRHVGLTEDETATLMCGLETEKQQKAMLAWMDWEYDKTGSFPKKDEVIAIISEIRNRFPTPDEEQPEQDPPSA